MPIYKLFAVTKLTFLLMFVSLTLSVQASFKEEMSYISKIDIKEKITYIKAENLLISQHVIEGNGDSLLHLAVKLNKTDELQELIKYADNNIEEIDIINKSGETALYCAVKYNRVNCARLLLTAGANINTVVHNTTPTDIMNSIGNYDLTMLLFDEFYHLGPKSKADLDKENN
jgi:ankyrin repeat protein